MAIGTRAVTLNDKEGNEAYEIKLITSGEDDGCIQIEQKQLKLQPPKVPLDELEEGVNLLRG